MKRLKELKRLVAIAAASMLLCGFMCQAAGGSGEEKEPKSQQQHAHAYSLMEDPACTGSTNESRHRYVVKTVTSPNGVEITYADCDVVLFFYADVYRCGCGDQYYTNYRNVRRHMNCGQ